QGIDRRVKNLIVQRCLPFLRGPCVLDLGYVDGSWTDPVLARGWTSDIVEGAERHVAYARHPYPARTDLPIPQHPHTTRPSSFPYTTLFRSSKGSIGESRT